MLIRNVMFYCYFFVTCVTGSIITLLLRPFLSARLHMKLSHVWGLIGMSSARLFFGIDFRIEGEMPDHPVVFASNHQSMWETFILPYVLAPAAVVMKRELFFIPIMGQALWSLRSLGIDRSQGAALMRRMAAWGQRRQKQNLHILIFPEGTRYAAKTLGPFLPGAAMLSKATGMPLVPVAINSGEHFGMRSFHKKPGTIRVIIGPELNPQDMDTRALTHNARKWIAEAAQLELVKRQLKKSRG